MHYLTLLFIFAVTPLFATTSYKKAMTVDIEQGTIILDDMARDHIIGDGLMTILNQAASEVAVRDGNIIGVQIFEIDKDSVFDAVGLKHKDIITHIDDAPITTPQRALEMLNFIKARQSFSYTIERNGKSKVFRVTIQ